MSTQTASEVVTTVIVESITGFWRYNRYTYRQEYMSCISMSGCDADPDEPWYVTFTAGKFADAVKVGDRITISGKFKRVQTYNDRVQHVLTHCKIL